MLRMWFPMVGMVFCICSTSVGAAEYRITPTTDLKPLLKQVVAGDTLVLTNGTWTDADLTFDLLPGTAEAPVLIRADTPGQVVFTGKTQFRFSGQYVVVSGLVFRNMCGVSDVVQLRTHSQRHAHHCQLTDCVFEETPESDAGIESRWLSVYGTNNRIDHCYFAGKKNRGTTLVVWFAKLPQFHRIDHNHFGPRPELGKNGGETIRMGTSDVSESDCQTTVEQNYFHACDGENEIISNKSCANTYRHNVFDECSGTLTLRHGHRCLVDSNLFLGRKKRGTGGVRIIGRSHTVTNNYFESLRGDDARAALSMMNGIPDSPLSGYATVRDATVSHNTFVDCKVSIEIGVGAGKTQSAAPENCQITHNVFLPDKWPVLRVHSEPIKFSWDGNREQTGRQNRHPTIEFDRVDLQFARGDDGLLRPTASSPIHVSTPSATPNDIDGFPRGKTATSGCDEPNTPLRQWPTASNTGPSWTK